MAHLKDNATIDKFEKVELEEEEVEEEEEEENVEEEEEEEKPKPKTIQMISARFVIASLWLLAFQPLASLILAGITTLIVASAKCFGAAIILTVIVVPAAYAISPKSVCEFKFRSIAPIIADGLYKLDYLVVRVTRVIGNKLKKQ